jgi:lysophospholipase L1-like esterase
MPPLTRRQLFIAAAAATTGQARPAAAGPAEAGRKRDWWDREFRTLVTLGESTTAGGWASTRERCWANQLARLINEFQRVPVQLVNVGIGGNVISPRSPAYPHSGRPAALERLDQHVLAHQPDLLVASYGLNDARGNTPVDLFTGALRTLIDRVRHKLRPLIVLPGPYYMTAFRQYGPHWDHADLASFHRYNEAIAKVAAEKDCLFVDLLAAYRNADWLVHHDGVHANDLGHRLVANKIFEVLAANCSGLARETKELEKHIPRWRDESVLQRDAR